jgi:hypothetical protein
LNETLDQTIINIENEILFKQNIIDGSNKLSITNVDLGTSALSYVDISSSLTTQLTNVNNAIDNSSDDLSSFNMNELQGEGFRVAGAGFRVASAGINKMKYIPKEDKIRKFVSLKL